MSAYLNLSKYLDESLEQYRGEKTEAIKQLVCKILSAPYAHWYYPGYAFPKRWFKELGHCRSSFKKVIKKYRLYTPATGYSGGSAIAYKPSEFHQILLTESPESTVMETHNRGGEKHNRVMRKRRHFSTGGLNISSTLPINRNTLNQFISEGYKHLEKGKTDAESVREYWLQNALRIKLYANSTNFKDQVPVKYSQRNDGRVFLCGFGLQNVKRELRNACFSGLYEYDFTNCHFEIAAQTVGSPCFSEYCKHRSEVLDELSAKYDVEQIAIKTTLIALLHGGGERSVAEHLPECHEDFLKDNRIIQLRRESREFQAQTPTHRSHYLCQEEHKILRGATKGHLITMPLFDGWISHEDLDTDEIEERIKMNTPYTIKVRKKQIEYNPCGKSLIPINPTRTFQGKPCAATSH